MIPLEDYEQIFAGFRKRMQERIDTYRQGIFAGTDFEDPKYCDYLREIGYKLPDDWPTLRRKDEPTSDLPSADEELSDSQNSLF